MMNLRCVFVVYIFQYFNVLYIASAFSGLHLEPSETWLIGGFHADSGRHELRALLLTVLQEYQAEGPRDHNLRIVALDCT